MYQAYIGVFWQKAIFSNRLSNSLLAPQPILQAFLLQCLLKENLKFISVFRVLIHPSRSTGIIFLFISLGIVVMVLLNCSPPCASQAGWALLSFNEKLDVDFSKSSSVSKHVLNKRKKSFCSLMPQQKDLSNMSAHLEGCSLSFPCFKKVQHPPTPLFFLNI